MTDIADQLEIVAHVGALTELVGPGGDILRDWKKIFPIDYPPFKRSKCYYMPLVFER